MEGVVVETLEEARFLDTESSISLLRLKKDEGQLALPHP